jgi:hypothetical protein
LPASPSLQIRQQRSFGNQALQRLHESPAKAESGINPSDGQAPRVIQRDDDPTVGTEPQAEAAVPSPDVNVESVDVENEAEVDSTFAVSPALLNGLFLLDPTQFNIYLSPLSPVAPIGPLVPVNSGPTFFPSIPSTLQSTTAPTASVPSQFSLYSAGFFHFRAVFEEPSLNVSDALKESEKRFSQFVTPPSTGIDTGALIKGLVTNFLTQTPPGQSILQAVTGAFGSAGDTTGSGPTIDLNLDVLPSPVLKGQAPSFMLNVEGRF